MAALSDAQLKALAVKAGAWDPTTATAIALGESGGDPTKHNYNPATGDDSYGLWQINMLGKLGPERRLKYNLSSNSALFDPATNARVANAVYRDAGHSFTPWSVFTSGKYIQYMGRASRADASKGGLPLTSIPGLGGLTDTLAGAQNVGDLIKMLGNPEDLVKRGAWFLSGGLLIVLALILLGADQILSQILRRVGKVAKVGKAVT